MTLYDVLKHPSGGMYAVKRGFSWPAFFFSIIWLLAKKLWIHAVILFISIFILYTVEAAFYNKGMKEGVLLAFALQILVFFFIGLLGNGWRKSNLTERGYRLSKLVKAKNPDAAIAYALSYSRDDNAISISHPKKSGVRVTPGYFAFAFIVLLLILVFFIFKEPTVTDLQIRNGIAYSVGDNKPFSGIWINSYLAGPPVFEIHFKNGKLQGTTTFWFSNKQKAFSLEFFNGMLSGQGEGWFRNGSHAFHGTFSDGNLIAPFSLYYDNGVPAIKISQADHNTNELLVSNRQGELMFFAEQDAKFENVLDKIVRHGPDIIEDRDYQNFVVAKEVGEKQQ